MMDRINFHFHTVPDWMWERSNYWNLDKSWKNKYKDRDQHQGLTFLGKWMTGLTDGWHLLKMIMKFMIIAAIVSYPGADGIYYNEIALRLIIDPILLYLAFQGGFRLTYK